MKTSAPVALEDVKKVLDRFADGATTEEYAAFLTDVHNEIARRRVVGSVKNRRDVWVVTDKPMPDGSGTRSFWTKVGSAHENRDGSTTVKLDALPLNGTLQLRDTDASGR